ncbi:hypothetical protein HanIR_Chr14g0714311 [Helianthus annuus]|nr:hypothetical protein HanIR_Chr14g0714311 [Helianthus annuus]
MNIIIVLLTLWPSLLRCTDITSSPTRLIAISYHCVAYLDHTSKLTQPFFLLVFTSNFFI